MKTFVSMFFYSSLLLSDPGEKLQDGFCHPGVGKLRLSAFRQDPSWGASCSAPVCGSAWKNPISPGRGVRCTDPEGEMGFSKRNQTHIQTGSGWPRLPSVLPLAPSFLQMWNKIKPEVCFTHTVSAARERACLAFFTLLVLLFPHSSFRHIIKSFLAYFF